MGKRRMPREAALELLGVARDAPPEDVRRAYHRKALASHPDKGGSAAAFQQVKEAFEVAKRPAVAPAIVGAGAFDVVAQARARRRLGQQHALLQPAVARRRYRPVVAVNAGLREGHLEAPAVSRVRHDASRRKDTASRRS